MRDKIGMIKDIENIYNFHSSKVINALKHIPREKFVPQKYSHLVYEDTAIPIGENQTISQPYTVALMTFLLDLKKKDKVLEIGTGSGYQSAILSILASDVYTIERISRLSMKAKDTIRKLKIKNIHFKIGNGEEGWKEKSPFNKIIITANTKKVPQNLFNQLSEGGILVAPVGEGTVGIMTKYIKNINKFSKEKYGKFSFVPLITS